MQVSATKKEGLVWPKAIVDPVQPMGAAHGGGNGITRGGGGGGIFFLIWPPQKKGPPPPPPQHAVTLAQEPQTTELFAFGFFVGHNYIGPYL